MSTSDSSMHTTYQSLADMPAQRGTGLPEIDPDRLNLIIGAFNVAFQGAPREADLINRVRMALDACPEEVVRGLGEAVDAFSTLIQERLGS